MKNWPDESDVDMGYEQIYSPAVVIVTIPNWIGPKAGLGAVVGRDVFLIILP
jgi:hypothetical protein